MRRQTPDGLPRPVQRLTGHPLPEADTVEAWATVWSRASDGHTLLLYAQDSKGMGHITRALTIAKHVLAAHPDSVAYITTESPITGDFPLPARCEFIQLPTHLSSGPVPKTEAQDEPFNQHMSDDRARILHDIATELAPDLVIVDHDDPDLGHHALTAGGADMP